MTLEEAIKNLQECFTQQHPYTPERYSKAKQLGIEALKRLGELRRSRHHYPSWFLSGETEE